MNVKQYIDIVDGFRLFPSFLARIASTVAIHHLAHSAFARTSCSRSAVLHNSTADRKLASAELTIYE